jgi:5-methyltetrahydropteroyltriglutamate--homocysteine methyltransferase
MAKTYRADHVGSLLRPPELLEARQAFDAKQISDDKLREVEDRSIEKALAAQRDAGLEIFSDGEYRRGIWYGPLGYAIESALVTDPNPPPQPSNIGWQGRGTELAREMMTEVSGNDVVVGRKIENPRRLTGHESGYLRRHAPGDWKITMPGVMHRAPNWFRAGLTDAFYPTREALVEALVGLVQKEVAALIAEGVSYIQLDSLIYVLTLNDPGRRQQLIDAGVDIDTFLDEVIKVDNACIAGARAAGVTVGLHMCRGNNRSAWAAAGSYATAERALAQLDVDRFLLEYDTERAGGFEPLAAVPRGKTVVLGLISSKEPQLEPVDDLLRRIEAAAKFVPMENLAISPQCGFASTYQGNLLTWDDQQRKLALIVETARRAWG